MMTKYDVTYLDDRDIERETLITVESWEEAYDTVSRDEEYGGIVLLIRERVTGRIMFERG